MAFSRFILRCDGLRGPHDTTHTRRRFERAFANYGLPERIRSDNGRTVCEHRPCRGSRDCRCGRSGSGIVPERIALGHPEQNGSHEQFHAVLKKETARPPAANAAERSSGASGGSAPNTITTGRMRPLHDRPTGQPLPAVHARPFPSARAAPRVSGAIRNPPRLADRSSCRGAGRLLFVSGALAGRVSPSKRSTTASGPSALPPWCSVDSTNVTAVFIRLPRSLPGAPPAPLAPRLDLKKEEHI